MDDAQQKGDIERLAKHADICKMHTYRDALNVALPLSFSLAQEAMAFYRTETKARLE